MTASNSVEATHVVHLNNKNWMMLLTGGNRTQVPPTGRGVVVFDMDGVLSDCRERFRTLREGEDHPDWIPDWDRFHDERMDTEQAHEEFVVLAQSLARVHDIYVLTSRFEKYRYRSVQWLRRNRIPVDRMLMRPDGGSYDDFKSEMLSVLLAAGHNIILGIDDDPYHRDVYESRGIPFLYVHSGIYDHGVDRDKFQAAEGVNK